MYLKKQWPFWIITLSLFIGLPGISLIQDGMFMDAMLYTSVAHNQAQGFGTFWFPQFSKINLDLPGVNAFHEQPPLVFWIQSLFFRVLGNSMYVERFYVFFTSCIIALLIHKTWRTLFSEKPEWKPLSWLPFFFWITTPTVFWGCSNNVNENTMGIFTLAAVLCAYNGLKLVKNGFWLMICSGVFIFMATLSKGFPGFFPLAVPFVYWLVLRTISFKKAIGYTFVVILVVSLLYFAVYLIPEGRESLSIYLFKRAFQRISASPTTNNRFQSLESLFMDILPQLGVLLLLFAIARYHKLKFALMGKTALFFFVLGLAASAPLMLTMVQKAFYLLPCFPYFAIGSATLVAPLVCYFIQRIKKPGNGFTIFGTISVLLLISAISGVVMMKGKTMRDRDVLHDVYAVGRMVGTHSDVIITKSAFSIDWELQCYLMRYFSINCLTDARSRTRYIIVEPEQEKELDLTNYKKKEINLLRYNLYELK